MSDSKCGVSTTKRHDKYFFRDGNVMFQVEDTTFRLHRHFFERESSYFRNLLASSSEDDGLAVNQYVIRDVTSDEFAHLVWVWYNPRYSFAKQEKKKWLTILRLATQWQFGEIRDLAIRQLEELQLEPIERITTYKEYAVNEDLLLPCYVSLCTSPTLPSPKEGHILRMETVLRIAGAREQIILRISELGCKTPTIASAPDDVVREVVEEIFHLTPHSNSHTVRMGGQTRDDEEASNDNSLVAGTVVVKTPKPIKKTETGSPESWPAPPVNGPNTRNTGVNKVRDNIFVRPTDQDSQK